MKDALRIRIEKFLKRWYPKGETEQVKQTLQAILANSEEGRVYRRRILSCYSQTKQAELHDDFVAAAQELLSEYQGRQQFSLFGGGAA